MARTNPTNQSNPQQLLRYLAALLEENVEVELCWRCVAFLLKTHHQQVGTGSFGMDLDGWVRHRKDESATTDSTT